jgi:hypothetical protein
LKRINAHTKPTVRKAFILSPYGGISLQAGGRTAMPARWPVTAAALGRNKTLQNGRFTPASANKRLRLITPNLSRPLPVIAASA